MKLKPGDEGFIPVSSVPSLTKFWDFDRNTLDINLTHAKSHSVAYWKCPSCGYEWSASIKGRYESGKCPCCDTNKVIMPGFNDAATLVPDILSEYDAERNKTEGIDISHEGTASDRHVWWKCPVCGKQWESSLRSRIHKASNGTYVFYPCKHTNSGKIKKEDNPRIAEVPKLMRFWDKEKNTLDPETVSSHSQKKAFWKCPDCGYEWQASIRSRSRTPDACPCCESGTAIRKGVNDFFTLLPEARDFYDFEKNKGIDVYSLAARSSEPLLWWKCPECGYEWQSPLAERITGTKGSYRFRGCQKCYCTAIKNPVSDNPELMKFWDKEKNSGTDPEKISARSPEPVWWKCPECGYEWQASPKGKMDTEGRCPCCDSSCAITRGYNDVLTLFPAFADTYDFEKNADVDIYSLGISSGTEVWFHCRKCGYRWKNTVSSRFHMRRDGSGYSLIDCPNCSSGERRRKPFCDDYPQLKEMYDTEANDRPLESIISTEDSRLAAYWICPVCHTRFSTTTQSLIMAIREGNLGCPYCSHREVRPGEGLADRYPEIAAMWSPDNDRKVEDTSYDFAGSLRWICPECGREFGNTISVLLSRKDKDYCPYCSGRKVIPGVNSLKAVYPDIAELWSLDNIVSDPDRVLAESDYIAKWNCPDCGHTYNAAISDMESGKADCPYCNGRRVFPGFNSLKAKYPELMQYWLPDNEIDPDDVMPTSSIRAHWICPTCGGEYSAKINEFVNGTSDCPYCADRRILPGLNSFKAKHPNLMDEWIDLTNSFLTDPDRIGDGSQVVVWWKCSRGHHYRMTPARRLMFQKRHKEPCPYCKGLRIKLRHFY